MALNKTRWFITSLATLFILGLMVVVLVLLPAQRRSQQVYTLATMNAVARYLKDYRVTHGVFPIDLQDAIPEKNIPSLLRDEFGFALYYESHPDAFILVSYGAKGEPDRVDYWALRNSLVKAESVAGSPSSDQILSDLGWHQEAGK